MRVLMVSKACVVGAYQKKLEELARMSKPPLSRSTTAERSASPKGSPEPIELTVVVPPYWRDERGVLNLERKYTTGYELIAEPMAFNGHFHFHFYPGLGKQIRRMQPDLVHIDEEPYNLATAQTLWLARRAGAKSLFFSWQNIERRYPLPFRLMESYVLNGVDYAIVGNQESARVWQTKGYSGPLAIIPQFGVDPESFCPESRPAGRGFVIGYVGRLVEEKGVDVLLEALAGLEGMWRAYILGSGPIKDDLQALARRLGLADRVSFDGWIPSDQMPAYYRQLDA